MNSDNIEEQNSPKPAIARQKGKLGAVLIDPKTGKPIPGTWKPKSQVPEKALKYLDPAKFAAAEKRNANRQAQIQAERERLKGVGNPPSTSQQPASRTPVVATTKPPATTQKPTTPAPRPIQQPKIEKSPAGYAVGSLGGVKFERRAATRAELDAARAAREAARKAGESKKQQELSAVKAAVSVSKNPMKEAFDVVLDYLFSEGHVDSLEEALYVMMEMSSETIQDIVEGDPSFEIRKSSGAGALTPDAAKQLGPKAIELQKKKAAEVDLPSIKQSPSSMVRGV